MRISSCLLLALLFVFSCSTPPGEPLIVFDGVTVIDALAGARPDYSVAVSGKNIISVGPSSEYEIPANATVVDASGKYLIPGLWDTHVHLSYEQDLAPAMFDMFLVTGVTSIRDTGGQLDLVMPWKDKSLKDDGTVPRVMVAGPLLDGVPTVYNGEGGRPSLGLGAANPDQGREMVKAFVDRGVDLIKSYEMLTPESFAAVLDEATKQGKVVTGHVPLSMDVIEASNLGLRSMEHMRNLEMACSSDYDSLLEARKRMLEDGKDTTGGVLRSRIHSAQRYHATRTQNSERRQEVLQALATNGTWQVPTMTIVMAMTNRVFDRDDWLADFKYMPDTVEKRWRTNAIAARDAIVTNEANKAFSNWAAEMIGHLNDHEIGIMAGTDTPIFFLTPGFSLHEELRLLVESGLTPLEALESATLRPAQYFGLEGSLGSIQEGKLADLVLLNANPLDDINNTLKIEAVMKSGLLHDRSVLDGMLKRLEDN